MKNISILFFATALIIFNLHGAAYNSDEESKKRKPLPPLTALYIQDSNINQKIANDSKNHFISEYMESAKTYRALKNKIEKKHPNGTATDQEIRSIQEQTIYYVLHHYRCQYDLVTIAAIEKGSHAQNMQKVYSVQNTFKKKFARIIANTQLGEQLLYQGLNSWEGMDSWEFNNSFLEKIITVSDLSQCIETLNKNIKQERQRKQPGNTIKPAVKKYK